MCILHREYGLLNDVKFFNGIDKLRIHDGTGYQIYFVKREKKIILLLNADDKSIQQRDTEKALQLVKKINNKNNTI